MKALGLLPHNDIRFDFDLVQALLETNQPVDHRFPCRQLREHLYKIGNGRVHFAEGNADLGQAAKRKRAGEELRRHDEHRYDRGTAQVEGRIVHDQLLLFHQRPKVFQRRLQALVEAGVFCRFTPVLGHRVGVFPQAHQREAKVGFAPLLHEIEPRQCAPQPERQPRAQKGVDEGDPHQQPRNDYGLTGEGHANQAGCLPEDVQEGKQ
ncbi:hypothetical protein D3C73_659650 [compost metagenome]